MSEQYFETIKCDDYEVFNLDYHKRRIVNTIGLNIALEEYIYPPSKDLLKCKLIYDESGIINIEYTPYKMRVIDTLKLIYDDNISYKYKLILRDNIDKLYMKREDCDDIVIVKNGLITDTSIANIAVMIDDIWYTPKTPLLYGTSRARYLDAKVISEKDITVDEFNKASKIALMNAMIDFYEITITSIDLNNAVLVLRSLSSPNR